MFRELLPIAQEHLVEMKKIKNRNERLHKNRAMHLWQAASIALAVQKVLIQYPDEVLSKSNKPFIFLIGGTGTGKSTTLCFLRKDKMTKEAVAFHSITGDDIIGHNPTTSKTFLANFLELEDCILVDFAGFEDSHGYFVALGVELALKSLLRRYPSKVMVVESITNNSNRYAAAAQLGSRLKRILTDYEKCILGITKYIQDPHFLQINIIEKNQWKEILEPINNEIEILKIQINTLEGLNQPEQFSIQITELKQKLESKQTLLKTKQEAPLKSPSTKKKTFLYQKISEKENELCSQIGIKKFIALDELEDNEELLNSCLKQLKDLPIVTINPKNELDSEHKKLLEEIFANDYLNGLSQPITKQEAIIYADFNSLKQAIIDSGLINAVLDKDIGTLFLLPEMSISLYQDFNEKLITTCMEKYINEILSLGLTQMYNRVFDPTLKEEIQSLKMLVKAYLFNPKNEFEEKENELNFRKREHTYADEQKSIDERFQFPYWVKYLSFFNSQKPITLLTCKNGILTSELEIAKAIEEIKIIKEQLKVLREIENVVHNRVEKITLDVESKNANNLSFFAFKKDEKQLTNQKPAIQSTSLHKKPVEVFINNAEISTNKPTIINQHSGLNFYVKNAAEVLEGTKAKLSNFKSKK